MVIHRIEHNRRRLSMHVHVCESRIERSRGLLLRRCPDQRTAYLLRNCSTAHTIGTTYPVDIIFCDRSGVILRIEPAVAPFRITRHANAAAVWQARAGCVEQWGWRVGDELLPSY